MRPRWEAAALPKPHDISGLIDWSKREEWRGALAALLDRHSAHSCAAVGAEMEDITDVLGDHAATLKNRILLENHYLPGELEAQVAAFVDHYNHRRVHESLDNLTPADVYFGRGQAILLDRQRIKRQTIQQRRLLHHSRAA